MLITWLLFLRLVLPRDERGVSAEMYTARYSRILQYLIW